MICYSWGKYEGHVMAFTELKNIYVVNFNIKVIEDDFY